MRKLVLLVLLVSILAGCAYGYRIKQMEEN
jgi:uncharacterized lipoprotein